MEVFIDIETIPEQPENEVKAEIAETIQAPATMKKQETIEAWHNGEGKYAGVKDAAIEDEYRKGALDGGRGEIISVCASIGGKLLSLYREDESESSLIAEIFSQITTAGVSSPYFIGHNVTFDLEFLWKRAVILGINPGFKIPFNGRHKSDYYCTMQAWAGYGKRISQDKLAKMLGFEGKPDDINGANVWDHYKEGNIERIAEYNQHDVETVISIYNRINFL